MQKSYKCIPEWIFDFYSSFYNFKKATNNDNKKMSSHFTFQLYISHDVLIIILNVNEMRMYTYIYKICLEKNEISEIFFLFFFVKYFNAKRSVKARYVEKVHFVLNIAWRMIKCNLEFECPHNVLSSFFSAMKRMLGRHSIFSFLFIYAIDTHLTSNEDSFTIVIVR